MKSFTRFIYEAVSSQTVANPNPKDDNDADMTVAFGRLIRQQQDMKDFLKKSNRLLVKVTMKSIHQDQMIQRKIH